MTDDRQRDWRKTAYLSKKNWPECIPWMGPKRRHGPYPWNEGYGQIDDRDTYPHTHPDAASVGELYMGDVCPWCGVPLRYDEEVIDGDGRRGPLHERSPDENPVPVYHRDCWLERRGVTEHSLDDFTETEA